jgi:hypothetical protein
MWEKKTGIVGVSNHSAVNDVTNSHAWSTFKLADGIAFSSSLAMFNNRDSTDGGDSTRSWAALRVTVIGACRRPRNIRDRGYDAGIVRWKQRLVHRLHIRAHAIRPLRVGHYLHIPSGVCVGLVLRRLRPWTRHHLRRQAGRRALRTSSSQRIVIDHLVIGSAAASDDFRTAAANFSGRI